MAELLAIVLSEVWTTLTQMAPYLLLGFAVAGAISAFIPPESVENHLGGHGVGPVFKAALLGIPLPLCSCSVLPVAMSLRRHGSSRGATVAFLLSTPQTGVDSIFVTYGLLGPIFAVFRPLAALITGVVGGILSEKGNASGNGVSDVEYEKCTEPCCCASKHGRVWRAFRYGFVTLPQDIGKAMLVGVLLAGLIATLVPDDFLAHAVGGGIVGILLMMLLGIPIYVCATASVPIAAALIAKGVSPGAALAFLITGPATNAVAVVTICKVLGGRTALVYLATVAVAAIVCGLTLDYLFTVSGVGVPHLHRHAENTLFGHISAIALLIVLGIASLREASRPDGHGLSSRMKTAGGGGSSF